MFTIILVHQSRGWDLTAVCPRIYFPTISQQEAQLPQRERATRNVS